MKEYAKRNAVWVSTVLLLTFIIISVMNVLAQRRVDRLVIGGGSTITRVLSGSVAWDPATIATIIGEENSTTITATGVAIGDMVFVNPTAVLGVTAMLGSCRVSAIDAISCTLVNPTAGTLDVASQTVNWIAIRVR